MFGLGFALSRRGLGSGNGGGINEGLTLDARATERSTTLDAAPTLPRLRRWINDPAYADRVGAYAAGGPSMALQDAVFSAAAGGIFTFSRASKAWDYDAYGLLSEHAVDAIRQGYDRTTLAPTGWRLEGAATNGIRNPRGAGVGTGTFGPSAAPNAATPTNWNHINRSGGLSLDVSPAPALAGMSGVRLRYYGTTASSPGAETLEFDTRSSTATPAGSAQTASFYYRLAAGALPAGTLFASRTLSLNASLAVADNVTSPALTLDGTLRRSAQTVTLSATAASAVHGLHMQNFPASTACDFTIDVYSPQFEANYFASSLILPPDGAPAATTRAADNLSIGGSAFTGIFGAGAPQGFVICDFSFPPGSVERTIAMLHNGGTNEQIRLIVMISGQLGFRYRAGGVDKYYPQTLGVVPTDAVVRVGARWGGGGAAACLNGGAVSSGASDAVPVTSTLNLGAFIGGTSNLNGRIRIAAAGAYAPTDARFQAACVLGANIDAALRS